MPQFELNSTMATQRALFDAGLELAGVRLQRFAEQLLQAADAAPGMLPEEVVRETVQALADGAVAVVADEPQLCEQRLLRPAQTVADAAEKALEAVGRAVLQAHLYGCGDSAQTIRGAAST